MQLSKTCSCIGVGLDCSNECNGLLTRSSKRKVQKRICGFTTNIALFLVSMVLFKKEYKQSLEKSILYSK